MGYTHYWRQHRDFTMGEWNRIMQRAARSVADSGLQEPDIRGLTINKDYIRFNGGCETFYLERVCPPKPEYQNPNIQGVFNFCKTNRHAYDPVIIDILRVAYLCSGGEAITPSSDGDVFDDVLNTLQEIN